MNSKWLGRTIVAVGTVIAVLAVILWPHPLSVRASRESVSISLGINSPAPIWEQTGYYYVSPWSGNGTRLKPFRPAVASNLSTWAAVDLRADASKVSGYTVVFSKLAGNVTTNVTLIGTNLSTVINTTALNALRTATGNATLAANTIPNVLYSILGPKLKAGIDKKVRIFLSGQVYGDYPPAYTHGTITESFNQGDSSTLGPDLSWVEVIGGWQTISNQCVGGGVANENDVYANSALSSANHYVQANVISIGEWGGGISARHENGGQYDYYSLQCSTGDNYWAMHKMYNDADSELATNNTGYSAPAGELWRLEADGSSLTGKIAGTTKITITDGDITSNLYAGLYCFPRGTASGYYSYFDNFEAGALVAVPDVSVSPTSKAFGTVAASTTYWSMGVAPATLSGQSGSYNASYSSGGWTNPTYAYTATGDYANITTNNPSANETYGSFNITPDSGYTIGSVQVSYNAWCVGSALTQNTTPSSNNTWLGAWTINAATSAWEAINDPSSDNNTDNITCTTNGGFVFTFGFGAFTVPTGSNITNLTLYYRARRGGAGGANITSELIVGGTTYNATDGGVSPPNATPTTRSFAYTVNPKTGIAWTAAEINGSDGTNPLQFIGLCSGDNNPNITITRFYAVVTYTAASDDQMRVTFSTDNGSTWYASKNAQAVTSANATYTWNITSLATWNYTSIDTNHFQLNIDAQTVGDTSDMRLDWICINVQYTRADYPLRDDECYFTLTNNGSGTVNITALSTNFSGGDGWVIVTGSPSAGQVRLTLFKSGDSSSGTVVLTGAAQTFIQGIAAAGTKKIEVKFETGTFTDAAAKTANITMTATAA